MRAALIEILSEPPSDLSPRIQRLLCDLSEDWHRLDDRIDETSNEIEVLAKDDTACQRLMTVPGIGVITASAMVAAIGTGQGFKQGRDFAAWIGLVPRQDSTGGRTKLGRLSKRGDKYLRTLFIQAAQVVLAKETGSGKACAVAMGRACLTATGPSQSVGNGLGQQAGAHCLGSACARS